MIAEPNDLLSALRVASKDSHDALDTSLVIGEITSSPVACEKYLQRFGQAFLLTQERLDWRLAEEAGLPDFTQRRQRYLGLPGASAELMDAGKGDLITAIGTLYVLEGSIHGGAVILGKMRAAFPDVEVAGYEFLEGFGKDGHAMWGRFVAWLKQLDLSEEEVAKVCVVAVEVFEIFRKKISI